jgi:pilus assembly protein CpaC
LIISGSHSQTWSAVLAVAVLPFMASAQTHYSAQSAHDSMTTPVRVPSRASRPTSMMHLLVGQSTIIHGAILKRIYIADPKILLAYNSAPDELVVTAKAAGSSSMVLWDVKGRSFVYDISADLDPLTLRAALNSAFPGNQIALEAEQDVLTLTGTVDSKEMADAAGKLATAYAKTVVNSLRVVEKREPQVELKLQILEVDRTKLEQLGFNIFRPAGNTVGAITTQQFPSTATVTNSGGQNTVSFSDPLNFSIYNFAKNIGATVQALEQKNVVQILAEPTLTALSGQKAQFLSGGEFPFPVVQGGVSNGTAITIQFRPYGVKMDFTPVVNPDGSIHLKVSPEVSALDYSNSVTISGYTIPALSTRRAETEVELKDGETFAISGLLDHRTTENLSKLPGIGDIPLLGQLFRSKNINHSVVELVVLVRARVLDPVAPPNDVAAPVLAVPNMKSPEFDMQLHKERPNEVPPVENPMQSESQQ